MTLTYTPTIEDGTYFIRDVGTGEYMRAFTATTGASIVTDDFSSDAICRWEISLQSSGYYRLKSLAGTFYLGIPANDDEEDEILVVVHEIGHWYNAPDHYELGGELSTEEISDKYEDRTFSRDCIYGENKEDANIVSALTICDGCRKTILENISRFDHE